MKTLHNFIFYKVFKAGSGSAFKKQLYPDPFWEKLMDPDRQKVNVDTQSCLHTMG